MRWSLRPATVFRNSSHFEISAACSTATDYSDGGNTLEEMAGATKARGYEYFGVADHSRSAFYASGLSIKRVREQHLLADTLNRRHRGAFKVFKGIFDFVVASVHSRFRLEPKAQTERIVRAVSNPHTSIFGHMTGRMLLRRPGYEVDVDRVLRACADYGVAVEINANPHRLDVDWRWHRRALELGCIVSINPDAHSTDELDLTRWGVLMARKGGVPADRVLNALSLDAIGRWLIDRRSRRRPPRKKALSARSRRNPAGAVPA
jgi:DNA polymerase (family 10)